MHPETVAVTAGRPPAEPDQPLNVPVTLTSTYTAGGDLEYGRYGNPSWTAFEDTLGALEGGGALGFSSGMAAIAAVLDLVPTGGRVVAPRHSYTGTVLQLRESADRGRLTFDLVDIADTEAVVRASRGAAMVWIESPTNPALETADIRAIADAVHAGAGAGAGAGAATSDAASGASGVATGVAPLVVVDNTFATPILQRPLEMGADVVVHSVTKYLGGHSDLLMGATVSRDDTITGRILATRSLRGATPGPLEAFLALRGMRTLAIRVERAQETARVLVEQLRRHPALDEVRYPGFGGIISIVLPSAEAADALIAQAALWRHATSLGGVESTFERRRRWGAEPETIPEGLVRLSVGLEHPDDLWADVDAALPSR